MRTAVIFGALLVAVGVALWLGGVFDSETAGNEGGTNATGGTDGDNTPGLNSGTDGATASPKERPPLIPLEMPGSPKLLVVGATPNSADEFLLKVLTGVKNASFNNWYLNPTNARPKPFGVGIPVLEAMPDGPLLEQNDYDVVVLSNVDPDDLPADFWEILSKRVTAGQTHVLWRAWPPYPGGSTEGPAMEHPWFRHKLIAPMLPVKKVLPLRGVKDEAGNTRLPGSFGSTARRFVPTEAGMAHPATRLVQWPEWSRVWWNELGVGKYALGVKFCVPVSELAEGATALLGVDVKDADDIPAVVVGKAGDGRVAWLGTREIGWESFKHPKYEGRQGMVIHSILAWLAGAQ